MKYMQIYRRIFNNDDFYDDCYVILRASDLFPVKHKKEARDKR